MPRDIRRLRNIGIMAHVDAGKTTVAERILFLAGHIREKGEVHHGNTHLDHHPLERKKGITIQAAASIIEWTPASGPFAGIAHDVQLIDTPGHVDFTIEVERALRVLDGAVFVLDAASGVECQSETVFRQAREHDVPCIAFVNKIDKPGADFSACLRDIEEKLEVRAVPVQLPHVMDDGRLAVIDVLERKLVVDRNDDRDRTEVELHPIPEARAAEVEEARRRVIEIAAESDEQVFAMFCSGDDPPASALASALRKSGKTTLVVLCGAALRDCGIVRLLDAVVTYLPSPRETDAPLAALAFKSTFDRNAGIVTWLRLYSGTLRSGSSVLVLPTAAKERASRIFRPDAGGRVEIDLATAGSVVCVTGLGDVRTGETVCDPKAPLVLESIRIPDPVVSVVLEPKTSADRDRLGPSLAKLLACDPSLKSSVDPETGQTILSGMGKLHLEIAVAQLEGDHNVALNVGKPRVAYRSTIARKATASYRHKKQTGGPGQFAAVTLEVAPGERGSGIVFSDDTRGGVVPKDLVPSVEKGIRLAAERGVFGGLPVVDVEVRLTDGEIHAKDSSPIAFEIASAQAFALAAKNAGAVVLEPAALVETITPEPHTGAVLGDLGARRGIVREVTPRGSTVVVTSRVPLAMTFDYVPRLRALTHGRGEARVTPDGYDVVPGPIAEGILAEA